MGLFDRWLKKGDALDNRVLEGCMGTLAQGDSVEKRRALYAALRTSKLMLATPGAEEGTGTSDGTRPIRFIATQDTDGTSMMLAFTSEAALLAWRPVGCTYTVLSARDVFGLTLTTQMQSILINPCGPAGGRLARREVQALAEGLDPAEGAQLLPKNSRILIAAPAAPPPAELHAALRAHASERVRALYFVTATIGGGAPHDLVGVDLAPGCSADDVIPALLAAVQPLLGKDALVDFLPLADDALAAEIRARGQRLL